MKLYIVCYSHVHGVSSWPIWWREGERKPTSKSEAKKLDDFEPDEGEWLDVAGPFDIPQEYT